MFVPGNRQRFIDKARGLDVDAVFLDLEDGVPPPEKPAARKIIADALARPSGGPARFVRINASSTPWFKDDMRAILVPGLDGICVPKVGRPADVVHVGRQLVDLTATSGRPVAIVAAIESALGLTNAYAIAASHPAVLALMLGAEDFALDLGLTTKRSRESRELLYARSALVVAACAARRQSIDGVFADLNDLEGLVAETEEARRLGFTGKSTFNPRQIQTINSIFTPSEDEIVYAESVVTAFEEAQARGDGSVAVGGQLVDLPIVQRARQVLESTRVVVSAPDDGGK
jgi:citrate lyase subunit beta/citryl-CoA lyase